MAVTPRKKTRAKPGGWPAAISACLLLCVGPALSATSVGSEAIDGRAGPEAPAVAKGPDLAARDIQARAWASSCATCHGAERSAVRGIPTLAGMPADDIVKAMLAYASGERPDVLKGQIARGYDEAVLRRIGAWYESLPSEGDQP
ncbi:MAG: hypothetical protein WBA83_10540 [Burkholderiaceae bacterium]